MRCCKRERASRPTLLTLKTQRAATMFSHKLVCFVFPIAACALAQKAAHLDLVKVESHSASRTIPLTAELMPYLQTDIEARVPGYVEKVLVDRGSVVHRGQLLVQLSAPEMRADTNAS